MLKKISKMNEAAWLLGIILCALGVCLCTKSGFGLSMVAAPPYILHLKLVETFSWCTQGTCEYIWQGFLMVLMCMGIQRFRFKYLLSFATGVIFGFVLDIWLKIFGGNGVYTMMGVRIAVFIAGELVTALAIAFFFRTKMPLEIYELVVTEVADRFHLRADKVKMANDIIMLAVSAALAFLMNGNLRGIGVGTVVITIVNAPLIRLFGKLLDKIFTFEPRFPRLVKALQK